MKYKHDPELVVKNKCRVSEDILRATIRLPLNDVSLNIRIMYFDMFVTYFQNKYD